MTDPLFALDAVSFAASGRRLIDGLDLSLRPGVTALIGRNGSCKSTLLKLLAGQTWPSAGAIAYRGQTLSRWPRTALARDLAFLPQITPATDGLTVAELVALGRYPWVGALGRHGEEDRRMIAEALAQCGLEAMDDRLVDTLSGGERQRAWIAMMLAQGAQTLLLDEPTSALDLAHQVEVLGLLRQTAEARGLSAVIVLHDVNMAVRFCDRVVALLDGAVIHEGAAQSLLDPALLQRIYGVEMQVIDATPAPVVHPL